MLCAPRFSSSLLSGSLAVIFRVFFWGSCLFCVSSNSVLWHHMILQQVP